MRVRAPEEDRVMDIEERAEKWAQEYIAEYDPHIQTQDQLRLNLVDAYLAGSAQTQRDYARSSGYGRVSKWLHGSR
jgi:hypothetical protein